jgi:putative phosphoribosyl transferase
MLLSAESQAVPFDDREDAGRRLGRALADRGFGERVVVLGLPRGGVPVAARVAATLGAPLDVLVVRKLGLPAQPEVAMGAIGESGVLVRDRDLMARAGVGDAAFAEVMSRERDVLDDRVRRWRGGRPGLELTGATALVVDDGIATGATASAACRAARALGASRVVMAAPVGAPSAVAAIEDADEVLCLVEPEFFEAVGAFYRDFRPTSDSEVDRLLAEGRATPGTYDPVPSPGVSSTMEGSDRPGGAG